MLIVYLFVKVECGKCEKCCGQACFKMLKVVFATF